jgi:hypothetical protein
MGIAVANTPPHYCLRYDAYNGDDVVNVQMDRIGSAEKLKAALRFQSSGWKALAGIGIEHLRN